MILIENGRSVVKGNFFEVREELTQALRAVYHLAAQNANGAPGSPEEFANFMILTAISGFMENKEIKKSEEVHNYAYKKGDTAFEKFLDEKYNLPL